MTRSRQTADWGSRAGLAKIVPSSITVGSGTGSASTTGTVTFSSCSSVSLNSVFDVNLYNYWHLEIDTQGSTDTSIGIRSRVDTTNSSDGVYGASYGANYQSSVGIYSAVSNSATGTLAQIATNNTYISCNIRSNASTQALYINGNAFSGAGARAYFFAHQYIASGVKNGFTLLPASGTLTGTLSVYGYN
jgi:hypothetical protein